MRTASPAQTFVRVAGASGLAGLAALTLVDKGATRMYSTPWNLVFWLVLVAPAAALLARLFDPARPPVLPCGAWRWVPGALGALLLGSALASPFRPESLLFAASPLAALAAFLLVFDWLRANPEETTARRIQLERGLAWFFAATFTVSLELWLLTDAMPALNSGHIASPHDLFSLRNEHPLGHSNYTAGLAVCMLPWFGARVWRTRGRARAGWSAAVALALLMLFTSGSRGGMLGLAGLLVAALALAWRHGVIRARHAAWLAAAALILAAGFALVNPRIRDLLATEVSSAPPDASSTQRSAMLAAGLRMGRDRPLAGWGPGVTPLVYPRYRAKLDGGVETALQLHCTPAQIWADLGAPGLIGCLVLAALAACAVWKNPAAAAPGITLCGYGIFSLTDFQLDVPIFVFFAAACAAACAPSASSGASIRARRWLACAVLAATAVIASLGRRDPTPALNVRALALGRDHAHPEEAIALLRESLALNPDQEIAHFNLGWLLVVKNPAAAERHFLAAAHLVPDKGGVYFGLGLARLNQGRGDGAARAFALECVNDPGFAASPWWRVPALAALRPRTAGLVAEMYRALAVRLPAGRWPGSEARYAAALDAWLFGRAPGREVAAVATTPARRKFFAGNPAPGALLAAPERVYRREATGYPVVMRDLDLPPPVDLFDVRDNALADGGLAWLFPEKGWLPSPLLIEFLDNSGSPPR